MSLEKANLEATRDESLAIKSLDQDDVHKICSGQVILTLAVAVKELIENSLDAGAKHIDVKLKNKGLDGIEVSDDGCGVKEQDIEGMVSKYHTSKIQKFTDLQLVQTFGFRGEALSSLCALSDMIIVTRHESAKEALKIELDNKGLISKRQKCTRTIGTSVILSNLFRTLPVRRRDFVRNIKKEFVKCCNILQAYSLISKGVRIRCTNLSLSGNLNVIMSTTGSEDLKDNIQAIFGKFKPNEILWLKSPIHDSLGELICPKDLLEFFHLHANDSVGVTEDDINHLYKWEFRLEGFISNCKHGFGRSSKDRQFIYVNNRPCDLKNVSKGINDCYRSYNIHQYPFICLNIIINHQEVDINLTPDKRSVLINNENLLVLLIQRSMTITYGQIPSTQQIQNDITSLSQQKLNFNSEELKVKSTDIVPLSTAENFRNILSQWKNTGNTNCTGDVEAIIPLKRKIKQDEIGLKVIKIQKIQSFLNQDLPETQSASLNDTICKDEEDTNSFNIDYLPTENTENNSRTIKSILNRETSSMIDETTTKLENVIVKSERNIKFEIMNNELKDSTKLNNTTKIIELDGNDKDNNCIDPNIVCNEININLDELELNIKMEDELRSQQQDAANIDRLRFKSTIMPSQNKSAEEELEKEITKESFFRMKVIGQFNRGFIIVKLDFDLFIVDQHATDEKYNFEVLQNTIQLQHQPLTVVQPLNMTVMSEITLLDNLEIFEKNGFKFVVDETAPATKKVMLVGKPFSKNWEFGTEDIDELIFMLQDAPKGSICRPSRISAMLASRACRSSIMIGQALKFVTMQKLISHMGEMEQPWNCPHGRPTMRHLVNIAMLAVHD